MNGPPGPEPLSLTTEDGVTLEAVLHPVPAGRDRSPAAAVVCHPHALYGGSMDNNVVDRLVTDLPTLGVPALRFNFRGVGRSGGTHGGGAAEVADVVAAIDAVAARHPDVPILAAGYSFGADVVLSVADDRIGGWLAVSPPLRIVDPAVMAAASDPRPTVIVTGTADDFRPADGAEEVVAAWPTTEVVPAPGVDHFWMTGLDLLAGAATTLLDRVAAGG